MPDHIELRSDTFTQPTDAMRQAIASAVVGDDMVGEDPTVNELERRIAKLLGTEAAVWMCSATQANQAAVWSQCRSGDEILIESHGHIANWEAGGPAVLSGVSVRRISGDGGTLTVPQIEEVLRPNDDVHIPPQSILCVENTTNMGGGLVWPYEQFVEVCEFAHGLGKRVHLDGARLFNAVVASGIEAERWVSSVDSVSICFSKGLGCPMGAVLASDTETIQRARRARKLFGGALRQSGFMAAAALHALDHHIGRLAEDHENAKRLAAGLAEIDGIAVDSSAVQTNILFAEIAPALGPASQLAAELETAGVKLFDVGPQSIRAVTHLDVTAADVDEALAAFRSVTASIRCSA